MGTCIDTHQSTDLGKLNWQFHPGDLPLVDGAPPESAAAHADGWRSVQLPHRWAPLAFGGSGFGWYRVTLPPASTTVEILDLGIVSYFCEAWLDNALIYRSGDMHARIWHPVHLRDVFPIPTAAGQARPRTLMLRVRAGWGVAGLIEGPFRLERGLRAPSLVRERQALIRRWGVGIALQTVLLFWTLLLGLLLIQQRPPSGLRPLFAFMAMLTAYYGLMAIQLPEPGEGFNEGRANLTAVVTSLLLAGLGICLVSGLYRLLEIPVPRRRLWVCACPLLVGATLSIRATLSQTGTNYLGLVFWLIGIGLVIWLLGLALRRGWRERIPHARSLGVALTAVAVLFFVDLLAILVPMPLKIADGLPVGTSRAALLSYSEVGLLVLICALGLALLSRFLRRERQVAKLTRQVLTAAESERQRISRELHDGVNPLLQTLKVQMAVKAADDRAAERVTQEALRDGIDRAIQEIRRSIHDQGSGWLEGRSFEAALKACAATFQEAFPGCTVQLQLSGGIAEKADRRMPRPMKNDSLRFFQEATRNACRHGQATRVVWGIAPDPADPDGEGFLMTCRDNGSGFDPASAASGVGLRSLRERAALYQTVVEVDARPGSGTALRWRVNAAALDSPGYLDHD
ncbi:MAG: histidine kinase [Opitutales bacterium]